MRYLKYYKNIPEFREWLLLLFDNCISDLRVLLGLLFTHYKVLNKLGTQKSLERCTF
jgi:hypothetical protein